MRPRGKFKRKVIRKARAIKTKLVCAHCRVVWRGVGSPAYCPDCGQESFPIALEVIIRR